MLCVNLNTSVGLVNGSVGTVRRVYTRDDVPEVVVIEFDDALRLPDELSDALRARFDPLFEFRHVPIPIVRLKRKSCDRPTVRTGFPLVEAHAITVHKAQGLTLSSANIDLGTKEFSAGLTYVAMSRVRHIEDVRLTRTDDESLRKRLRFFARGGDASMAGLATRVRIAEERRLSRLEMQLPR